MLLTSLVTLLPLLAGVSGKDKGPLLYRLEREGTPAAHLAKRQDAAGEALRRVPLGGTIGLQRLTMNISVGTPPQEMRVGINLDPTPNNLRLTSCSGDCAWASVTYDTPFVTNASSTFKTEQKTYNKPNNENTTATHPETVIVDTDTVTIGGVTLQDQPITVLDYDVARKSPDIYTPWGFGYSGELSFSLYEDNSSSSLSGEPFMRSLSKRWPSPEFGLFVTPYEYDQVTDSRSGYPIFENSGELALGGLNTALYTDPITYVPTVDDRWRVRLNDVRLDGKSIMASSAANATAQRRQDAVNGTSGSPDLLAAFWFGGKGYISAALGAALVANIPGANRTELPWPAPTDTNMTMIVYIVPCDTDKTLTIDLGAHKLDVPASTWVQAFSNDPDEAECMASFMEFEDDSVADGLQIGLGLNTLQNWYTAFKIGSDGESPQIGFAKLSDAAKGVTPNTATPIPGASTSGGTTSHTSGASGGAQPVASSSVLAAVLSVLMLTLASSML